MAIYSSAHLDVVWWARTADHDSGFCYISTDSSGVAMNSPFVLILASRGTSLVVRVACEHQLRWSCLPSGTSELTLSRVLTIALKHSSV